MGLFSRKEQREASNKEMEEAAKMGIELKTYDAEKETNHTERGSEIVKNAVDYVKNSWEKSSFPKLKKVGEWFSKRSKEVFFGSISLTASGIQEVVETYKEGKEILAEKSKQRTERKEFKQGMKEGIQEMKREAWEKKKAEMSKNFKEKWTDLKKFGIDTYNKTRKNITEKKDRFANWSNEKRMSITGTAELHGEVAELKEQISRLTALVEARGRLDTVEPEPDFWIFSSMSLEDELTGADAQEALVA